MRISDWSSDVCSSDLGDLFGREIPCDIVETDIAGVRADALIIVIAARETQLEVVNERDVVVGANDGQHEYAEDALRGEVPFRRIADARSAGRSSDKNATAERLPAHLAHVRTSDESRGGKE